MTTQTTKTFFILIAESYIQNGETQKTVHLVRMKAILQEIANGTGRRIASDWNNGARLWGRTSTFEFITSLEASLEPSLEDL
jgi:hypothetical protein